VKLNRIVVVAPVFFITTKGQKRVLLFAAPSINASWIPQYAYLSGGSGTTQTANLDSNVASVAATNETSTYSVNLDVCNFRWGRLKIVTSASTNTVIAKLRVF